MNQLALVAVLGGLGAVVRFLLSKIEGKLPWGILIANTLAAAIGASAVASFGVANPTTVLLVAGFAGGLSTFSTLIAQTASLWLEGKWGRGWWNLALNLVVPSTIAFGFGISLVALLK